MQRSKATKHPLATTLNPRQKILRCDRRSFAMLRMTRSSVMLRRLSQKADEAFFSLTCHFPPPESLSPAKFIDVGRVKRYNGFIYWI